MLIDREKMLVLTFMQTRLPVGFERSLNTVITGFNTDIEHDGVVYHVQTEDKGLDSPIILSLVYVGGTILASKRSPYKDLIAEGFSDEVLAERLKRQHRLICAAINSGRIDDLKKMSGRGKQAPGTEDVVETIETEEIETAPSTTVEEPFEIEYWPVTQEWAPPPPREETEEVAPVEEEQPEELEATAEPDVSEAQEPLIEPVQEDGLAITLLDDEEFYSGQRCTLRVLISNRSGGDERPLANTNVSVKILGTTFRPLIFTLKTESDGVLVRAVAKDQAAELRRIIHPAP
jgi:hypothetical protein